MALACICFQDVSRTLLYFSTLWGGQWRSAPGSRPWASQKPGQYAAHTHMCVHTHVHISVARPLPCPCLLSPSLAGRLEGIQAQDILPMGRMLTSLGLPPTLSSLLGLRVAGS